MNKLWQKLGVMAFWLSWPGLWFLLNGSKRARVLVVQKGEVLVVKSWLGDGKWSLPGGGMKRGESTAQAASRELEEEIGLHLDSTKLKLLTSDVYRFHNISAQTDCFVATTDEAPVLRRRMEVNDCQWFQPEQLNADNASPDVMAAIKAWGKQHDLLQ